jgi:peptidoglycan hydrolase-like protein with peptidoglycan-binding domain
MHKKEFINSIKEGALKGQQEYSILPSLTIAQAILESGWGRSSLAVKAKNLFGIKAFANWKGERITLPTTEWYNGQSTVVQADFRVYNSFSASIEDHNKLLLNSRYKTVRQSGDYKTACLEIYTCGYATDPMYPEKLISTIEANRLYEFDAAGGVKEPVSDQKTQKVRRFQHLCNVLGIKDLEGCSLVEDNIIGHRTTSCLRKMPILMQGSIGPAVFFIQEELGSIPVDGEFGHVTRCAVMEYQEKKGLAVDGIVGRETWTALVTK